MEGYTAEQIGRQAGGTAEQVELFGLAPMNGKVEAGKSYSEQYDEIFSHPLRIGKAVKKPSKEAQGQIPGAPKVWWSDVAVTPKTRTWRSPWKWDTKDWQFATFIGGMHAACLLAPACYSHGRLALMMGAYMVTGCLGITLGYHRMLSHRSLKVPRPLEYFLAYCGVLSCQGDPMEWASVHRYHHLHTDSPLDPHSSYEGFWWSHIGWVLDAKTTDARSHDRGNVREMRNQPFYRHLEKHYVWHALGQFAALYAAGCALGAGAGASRAARAAAGKAWALWGGCARVVWVWHITWFVNSASHVWGRQDYNTGDLSRNNWWVGILAFGEGWHNNHHAFEYSARHGLKWWQVDLTWMVIRSLQAVGLAKKVLLPSERAMSKLAFKEAVTPTPGEGRWATAH